MALVFGVVLGAVTAWLVARRRAAPERQRIESLEAELAARTLALAAEQGRSSSLGMAHARLEERLRAERQALEQASHSLKETFDAVAAKALEDNNRNFLALAQLELGKQQSFATSIFEHRERAIANLLTPIHAKFDEFQQRVASLEKDGVEGRTELRAQIDNLRSLDERLRRAVPDSADATDERPAARRLSA